MYDRRVVRGNTFAALVIPVSKLEAVVQQYRAKKNFDLMCV